MTDTQGKLAVEAGKTLENIIQDSLSKKGFTVVNYRTFAKSPAKYGKELLLKNSPLYKHLWS